MNGELNLEDQVIGFALTSPRDLHDLIAARVRPEHFANPVHAQTWKVILEMEADGEHVDAMTVEANRAKAERLSAQHITAPFLIRCLQATPPGHQASSRAKLLKEDYDRRQTTAALVRAQQALDGGIPVRDVRLETMASLQEVTDDETAMVSLGQSLEETISGFDKPTRFTPTPWVNLNRIIRGWRPGGLYVVGARPGVGKSLFLQAAALGLSNSGPVLFEAMEMDHTEVTTRLLAQVSSVSQGLMTGLKEDGTSNLKEHHRESIAVARQKIEQLPLVFGHNAYTVPDIREHARQLRVRGPLAGIVVDYLQLMGAGYRIDNRVQEISLITRQLKMMATEFDCPVILASQLSRAGTGIPALQHFRDSGSIEQDGDVLIALYNGNEDPDPVSGIDLDAIVLKNRQGPIATATMHLHGRTATIEDSNREPISKGKDNDFTPRN